MKINIILKVLFLVLMYNNVYSQPPKFDYGLSTYKKGNCMGCHKWHGDGGPGYGGAALSLRETGPDDCKKLNSVSALTAYLLFVVNLTCEL